MRILAAFCLTAALVVGGGAVVQAHRVNIFAFVDGDALQVECGFSRSQKIRQGTVTVLDAASGISLATMETDEQGMARFPLTSAMRQAPQGLKVVIAAGEGHQNEWDIAAGELQTASLPETVPHESSGPNLPPAVAEPQSVGKNTLVPSISCLTSVEVEHIVNRALDAKLAPVKHLLAEQFQSGPTLKDIIGGLGWIVGLAGIAAWLKRRS